MIERHLHTLRLEEATAEDIAATRNRLKSRFPRGATRRMTQLGMLVSATLQDLDPQPEDAIIYASAYAESCALENYLDSFPTASPTLFQTSIHPSAVQQALIGRQQPIREFLPLTGRHHLVGSALQAALLSPCARVIVCGGEERGSWLLDHHVASDRSFAFAFALTAETAGAMARVRLETTDSADAPAFTLPAFFDALTDRAPIDQSLVSGQHLSLQWR